MAWVCRVRGGVPPRTFFFLSPTDEACNIDNLSHVSLLGLVSVLGQGSRRNTLFWAIVLIITLLDLAKDHLFLSGVTICGMILLSFLSPIFRSFLKDDLPSYL